MERIKIAHLVHSFGTGGIENGIVNLANGMDSGRFYHYIICFTGIGDFQHRVKTENSEFICINKLPGNSIKPFIALWKIFRSKNIDIVHARSWATMAEGIISARLAGVPVILYGFHGKTHEDLTADKHRRKIAQKILIKMTDGVLTLIEDMKEDLCRTLQLSPSMIDVIQNGVDTSKFIKNVNPGLHFFRDEFGIKQEETIIGAVGRLDSVKNYGRMIVAFSMVCLKYDYVKLVIVGEGDEAVNLRNGIERLGLQGKVIMAGRRDDIPSILSAFDIFVQPSLYEGLSNTILEAMASGLPVIASNAGGNKNLIIEGENGILFNPHDTGALAAAMDTLCSDAVMRKKMSDANSLKIKNDFSLENMLKKYEEYYLGLYNKKMGLN